MKYIEWLRMKIASFVDPKIIIFPETQEMIDRKIATAQKKLKDKKAE